LTIVVGITAASLVDFFLNALQVKWVSIFLQADCLTIVVGITAASPVDFCFCFSFLYG